MFMGWAIQHGQNGVEIMSKYKIVYKYQKGLTNYSSVVCATTDRVVIDDLTHAQCVSYIRYVDDF